MDLINNQESHEINLSNTNLLSSNWDLLNLESPNEKWSIKPSDIIIPYSWELQILSNQMIFDPLNNTLSEL